MSSTRYAETGSGPHRGAARHRDHRHRRPSTPTFAAGPGEHARRRSTKASSSGWWIRPSEADDREDDSGCRLTAVAASPTESHHVHRGFGREGARRIDRRAHRTGRRRSPLSSTTYARKGDSRTGRRSCQRSGDEATRSFPRQYSLWVFDGLYREGKDRTRARTLRVNLAERIRAAGAEIGGLFTPTGAGPAGRGQGGRSSIGRAFASKYPIKADFALVERVEGRPLGNVITARYYVLWTCDGSSGEKDGRPGR